MPVLSVYQHGSTSGTPPGMSKHERAKRDKVTGWTSKTARSNTAFLRSVVLDSLSGVGFAFTLTIRDCPDTHADWHKLRDSYLKRLNRMGAIRVHWVTEWQKRGVPHLHGVVYFPEPDAGSTQHARYQHDLIKHWLEIAKMYTCLERGQNSKPISDSLGWLQYLAKHASRGAHHYQRSSLNIPDGWKQTGRMWGRGGDWPIADPLVFNFSREANFAYRRLLRGYRVAQARIEGNPRGIKAARRMLNCNVKNLSEVRGTSAWIPEHVSMGFIHYLASSGHTVTQ
jgi:hypothetical protein